MMWRVSMMLPSSFWWARLGTIRWARSGIRFQYFFPLIRSRCTRKFVSLYCYPFSAQSPPGTNPSRGYYFLPRPISGGIVLQWISGYMSCSFCGLETKPENTFCLDIEGGNRLCYSTPWNHFLTALSLSERAVANWVGKREKAFFAGKGKMGRRKRAALSPFPEEALFHRWKVRGEKKARLLLQKQNACMQIEAQCPLMTNEAKYKSMYNHSLPSLDHNFEYSFLNCQT